MKVFLPLALCSGLALAAFAGSRPHQEEMPKQDAPTENTKPKKNMQLGVFSTSLAVKDIKKSRAFYEKLDFKEVGGKMEENWIILQNGNTTIGLFQGMFEDNLMTFNPGWDKDKNTLKKFHDVREIQAKLAERGITPVKPAEAGAGPANFVIKDPDGNTILFDQHVDKPKK